MATINDARIAGLRAAMEPADPREVPAQFARSAAHADAWLSAYDGIATAMLNQRPDVMEAPAKCERHVGDKEHSGPKKMKAAAVPTKVRTQAKPSMMAILEDSLADQS